MKNIFEKNERGALIMGNQYLRTKLAAEVSGMSVTSLDKITEIEMKKYQNKKYYCESDITKYLNKQFN